MDNEDFNEDKSVDGVSAIEDNHEQDMMGNTILNNDPIENKLDLSLNVDIPVISQEKEVIDDSKPLKEIIAHLKLQEISIGEIVPNFSKVLFQNKIFKFYMGKLSSSGVCSLIVINGISKAKSDFLVILNMLSKVQSIDHISLLKLKGVVIIDENTCYLLFDPVMSSYFKRKKEGVNISSTEKFIFLFYIIEMLAKLHEKVISIDDLKQDNILFNSYEEFKYLIPLSNLFI